MFQPVPVACCDFPACRGACCVHGVWVDLKEREAILHHAPLVRPLLPEDAPAPEAWFMPAEEADPYTPSRRVRHTRVLPRPEHPLGTACVFWLPPEGHCALQRVAESQGWHPWALKPFYCVLHPLDFDDEGRITLDDPATLRSTPGGCVRVAEEARPPVEVFAAELAWIQRE
jgi:hypothetical protein